MDDGLDGGARPRDPMLSLALGIGGGILGGAVGYLLFFWIVEQGFYAMVLPGAMVGIACGAVSRRRCVGLGVFCGVFGVVVGLFTEWRFAPFAADHSLGYFVRHIHQLRPITLIMIAVGAALSLWLGLGRETSTHRKESES